MYTLTKATHDISWMRPGDAVVAVYKDRHLSHGRCLGNRKTEGRPKPNTFPKIEKRVSDSQCFRALS